MTQYGYCRLKKEYRSTDNQYEFLLKANISPENIFKDIVVGQSKRLPEFDKLMDLLKPLDSVLILDIDILGQTLEKRVITIYDLHQKGVFLKSINDSILPDYDIGLLKMVSWAALGQKELNRKLPIRTMEGLKEARQRGMVGGRTEGLTKESEKTAKKAAILYREGKMTRRQIVKMLGISDPTYYKYLRHEGIEIGDSFKPNKPENNVE